MWSNSVLRPVIIPQMFILPPSKNVWEQWCCSKTLSFFLNNWPFETRFAQFAINAPGKCHSISTESAYYDLKCTTPGREPQRCPMRRFLRYRCFIASRAALLIALHGDALQFVSCQRAIKPSVSAVADRQPRGLRDIWKAWQQKHKKGVRLER